ncbi:NRAMP family divalent metal transporter [Phytohabitans kaempferiae]|uniref:NRAMP family divalent metal transporter n=1 Tax=Phytohabitans kaempferiae TaxID=1620943 RepID=A0ABV6MBJ3_9ACTN
MSRLFRLSLGIMTSIGGFVDIGNLVTSGISGARFGMSLTWAIIAGTIAMTLYGEMAGRVASVARRPVFHVIRERLGVRTAMLNLVAFVLLAVLTLAAEIGGLALVLELVTGVNYLVWVPWIGAAMWLVVWWWRISVLENLFGMLGLTLLVFVVALFALPTDWGAIGHGVTHPWVPAQEGHPMYLFYAISLFGACVTPYQVVFFASGGREEHWTAKDLREMRLNALIGFPLGGLLSVAIMAAAVVVLRPAQIDVSHLGQVALPVVEALGPVGLVLALTGFTAAIFAAGVECTLSIGYSVAQFFGWGWGKDRPPRDAPRFHLACLVAVVVATAFILTSIDPITLTVVSVVLGAAAVPLTYFPVLTVANDRRYMGRYVNRRWVNGLAVTFLLGMTVVSVVALPLIFITKAGQ